MSLYGIYSRFVSIYGTVSLAQRFSPNPSFIGLFVLTREKLNLHLLRLL